MFKHYIDKHEDEDLDLDMFGVRIISFTRSTFERQILESVLIQDENSTSDILNSKSEYNRSALPTLTSKLGEHTYGEEERKAKEDKKKEEEEVEESIRKLRKEINAKRRKEDKSEEEPLDKGRKEKRRSRKG